MQAHSSDTYPRVDSGRRLIMRMIGLIPRELHFFRVGWERVQSARRQPVLYRASELVGRVSGDGNRPVCVETATSPRLNWACQNYSLPDRSYLLLDS